MDGIAASTYQCSVARTVEVVGERWTMLILREAFLGVKRFDHIQRDLGIARNILSDRLGKLVDQGILEKRRYSERPPRFEYRLTAKGRDLYPIVVTLMQWGDKYTAPDGAPVELTHIECGQITQPQLTCDCCGKPVHALNVRPVAGPGLRADAA
ncbi:putative HTH-type transcriptional regulator [Paraconexibacter sp. AEG42_29]|uniref:HTH-type transcriptional regulator n=1 Tax=Paraconexibacter sp. AEG42_29 TaxID=2997339 RepID=A0AAU7AP50_9ACTN